MDESYDIIFIGAGISCAYTLIHLLNSLSMSFKAGNKLKILIIEKEYELLWMGLPYGNRSGKDALIITPLSDFIHTDEMVLFLTWLQRNFDNCFGSTSKRPGKLLADWLKKNSPLIKDGNWQELYIPRYWFGLFIKERVNSLLSSATSNGLITYSLLNASVNDVRKDKSFYEVTLHNSSIHYGKKVVLAIGDIRSKPINISSFDKSTKSRQLFINDIYRDSLPETLRRIGKLLNEDNNRLKNVLIIGAGISALELIYHFENKILKQIDKLYIISSAEILPGGVKNRITESRFVPPCLTGLKTLNDYTADQIFQCFVEDSKLACILDINHENYCTTMWAIIQSLVNALKPKEQFNFVLHYEDRIKSNLGRASGHYFDKLQLLVHHKKIEFIKGNFEKANEFGFEYRELTTDNKVQINSRADIIINCAETDTISKHRPESDLVKNLINRKICKPNPSLKGFCVNSKFEASTNFYIMGPLLAGNLIGKHKIWHADSCKGIYELTYDLQKYLLK